MNKSLLLLFVLATAARTYCVEWADFDPASDTWVLEPFVVNGNDPATFDWSGFLDFMNDHNWDDVYVDNLWTEGETGAGSSAQTPQTVNAQFAQSTPGACLFAALRYAMNKLGVTTPPTEAQLLAAAAQTASRTAAQMADSGIKKADVGAALPNLMQGTNLVAEKIGINTTRESYTSNQALQAFTNALQPGSIAIGSFFVGRTVDLTTGDIVVQTHAQVFENRSGTVYLWNPEGGGESAVGSVNDAFNLLVGGYRGNNDNEQIANGSSYLVTVKPTS